MYDNTYIFLANTNLNMVIDLWRVVKLEWVCDIVISTWISHFMVSLVSFPMKIKFKRWTIWRWENFVCIKHMTTHTHTRTQQQSNKYSASIFQNMHVWHEFKNTPSVPKYLSFRDFNKWLHTEQNEWIYTLKYVYIHPYVVVHLKSLKRQILPPSGNTCHQNG